MAYVVTVGNPLRKQVRLSPTTPHPLADDHHHIHTLSYVAWDAFSMLSPAAWPVSAPHRLTISPHSKAHTSNRRGMTAPTESSCPLLQVAEKL